MITFTTVIPGVSPEALISRYNQCVSIICNLDNVSIAPGTTVITIKKQEH